MIAMAKRAMLLYIRSAGAVLISLLGVILSAGFYALFFGDLAISSFKTITDITYLMDSWAVAGVLSVASITSSLSVFGVIAGDRAGNILKDFYTSPMKKGAYTCGAFVSAFLIGFILSLLALVVGEIAIFINGGDFLPLASFAKLAAGIAAMVFTSSAIALFIASLIKSKSVHTFASVLSGIFACFLTGVFIPVGDLPIPAQYIVKIFPLSHGAALLRRILMEVPLIASFKSGPEAAAFAARMGVVVSFSEFSYTQIGDFIYLLSGGLLFLVLSIIIMAVKRKAD
jgi:multidrug/hemolysin transport system permease protein